MSLAYTPFMWLLICWSWLLFYTQASGQDVLTNVSISPGHLRSQSMLDCHLKKLPSLSSHVFSSVDCLSVILKRCNMQKLVAKILKVLLISVYVTKFKRHSHIWAIFSLQVPGNSWTRWERRKNTHTVFFSSVCIINLYFFFHNLKYCIFSRLKLVCKN